MLLIVELLDKTKSINVLQTSALPVKKVFEVPYSRILSVRIREPYLNDLLT